jgi:type IX secretion system PorP/SprF family membrane protein
MKNILFIPVLFIACALHAQQLAQYSHYMFNGLPFNPAYAGSKETINADLLYRSQMGGFEGNPETFQLGVHSLIKGKDLGVGFDMVQDRLGVEKQTIAHISNSYRFQIDNGNYISMGLSAGMIHYTLNSSGLETDEPDDQLLQIAENGYIMPDARFGVYYNAGQYYAGWSMTSLLGDHKKTAGETGIQKPRVQYILTSGYLSDINDRLKLYSSFFSRTNFKDPALLDISNFLLIQEKIWVGASYRMTIGAEQTGSNSLACLSEIYINPQIRLGYAFEYNLTALDTYGHGTNEFSIGYYFNAGRTSRMLSPRFF